VVSYLSSKGFTDVWSFCSYLLELIKILSKDDSPQLVHDTNNRMGLEIWERHLNEGMRQLENNEGDGLILLYEKPLIDLGGGKRFILDKQLLIRGLVPSVMADFMRFNSLPRDFKSVITDDVFEKILFRQLIMYIFPNNFERKIFDDSDKDSADAVVIRGNDVFIFEFKSASMPFGVIEARSVEAVIEDIGTKFIKDKKRPKRGASTQLARYTHNIHDELKKSCRIYPLIVYTDGNYMLPGVEDIVRNDFNNRILKYGYRNVQPLTMISYTYAMEYAFYLRQGGLRSCLSKYHEFKKKWRKKLVKESSWEQENILYKSFEEVLGHLGNHTYKKDKQFIRHVLQNLL
jgi:hypothetical protein